MKPERLWTEPPSFERRAPTVSDRQLTSSSKTLESRCVRPASFSTYRISGSPSSSNEPGEAPGFDFQPGFKPLLARVFKDPRGPNDKLPALRPAVCAFLGMAGESKTRRHLQR